MKAFHGDPKVKKFYLDRVIAHQKADEIIKGKYWENGKGCAVGCTIHGPHHKDYEKELGIPEWLARVEDTLFEGMPLVEAKAWPAKFLKSIKLGVDLEKVKAPFLIFVLECALEKFDHKEWPEQTKAIKKVISLYKTNGSVEQFQLALAAVYAAYAAAPVYAAAANAAYAAYTAAADAADAAYAAAPVYAAAANAANAAAAAAAAAAANADAGEKEYLRFANKLIEIIKGLKTGKEK